MRERLQKILSARGVCSRRRAEELIAAGRVTCNGVTAAPGDCADTETDRILVDGKPLPSAAPPVYILLNKPRGYVTTLSDEKGRPNAAELVAGCGRRVYPVGRLDMDSEGLLLFTSDGEFANLLMHPSHEVDKTYRVSVRGFSDGGLEKLKKPVTLDGYTIRPPGVKLLRRDAVGGNGRDPACPGGGGAAAAGGSEAGLLAVSDRGRSDGTEKIGGGNAVALAKRRAVCYHNSRQKWKECSAGRKK